MQNLTDIDFQIQLSQSIQKVAELEILLKNKSSELDEFKLQLKSQRQRRFGLEEAVDQLKCKFSYCNAELDVMNKQKISLDQHTKNISKELEQIKKKLEDQELKNESLQKVSIEAQKESIEAKKLRGIAQMKLKYYENFEAQRAKQSQNIAKLTSQKQTLQVQVEQLSNGLKQKQNRIIELENEVKKGANDSKLIQISIKQTQKLMQEKVFMESKLKQMQNLQKRNLQLEKKLNLQQNQINSLKKEVSQGHKNYQLLQISIKQAQNLRQQNSHLKKSLNQKQTENSQLKKEILDFKKKQSENNQVPNPNITNTSSNKDVVSRLKLDQKQMQNLLQIQQNLWSQKGLEHAKLPITLEPAKLTNLPKKEQSTVKQSQKPVITNRPLDSPFTYVQQLSIKKGCYTQDIFRKSTKMPEYWTLDHSNVPIDMDEFLKYDWSIVCQINFENSKFDQKSWIKMTYYAFQFPQLYEIYLHGNPIRKVAAKDLSSFKILDAVFFHKREMKQYVVRV